MRFAVGNGNICVSPAGLRSEDECTIRGHRGGSAAGTGGPPYSGSYVHLFAAVALGLSGIVLLGGAFALPLLREGPQVFLDNRQELLGIAQGRGDAAFARHRADHHGSVLSVEEDDEIPVAV